MNPVTRWSFRGTAAMGWFWSVVATGQPALPASAPTTPSTATTQSGGCTYALASALSELACELTRGLASVPPGALVVSAPLVADGKVDSPRGLTARLARLVAGSLGRNARAHPEPAELGHAQTLASRSSSLVHLTAELVRGELRVVADAYQVPRNFWQRVLGQAREPEAHAFSARRIDAEIRTFLPPVPLVARRMDRAACPEKALLAVACADLDQDGALELVVAGRRQVLTGRVRGGQFTTLRAATWSNLSPIAPSPWREPTGIIAARSGGLVDVGISDRTESVRLDASLEVKAKMRGRLPWPGSGCAEQRELVLGSPSACLPKEPLALGLPGDETWDALAGARIVAKNGEARWIRAARVAGKTRVELFDDRGRRASVTGAGAQLALGDWDGDGDPELATSAATLDPAHDAVVLYTWTGAGQVQERFRLAVPQGVRALALCPAEGTGLLPLVIAAGEELWIVR